MDGLEKIACNARNTVIAISSLALLGLSYAATLEFARIERENYATETLRDTSVCYRVNSIDGVNSINLLHQCWNNEAAKKRDFYDRLYSTLAFKEPKYTK